MALSLELFDLARNCSQTARLYNFLHFVGSDALSLLHAVLREDSTVADSKLVAQLDNMTFVKTLWTEAAQQCQPDICISLSFAGNADIAGIGVRSLSRLSKLSD